MAQLWLVALDMRTIFFSALVISSTWLVACGDSSVSETTPQNTGGGAVGGSGGTGGAVGGSGGTGGAVGGSGGTGGAVGGSGGTGGAVGGSGGTGGAVGGSGGTGGAVGGSGGTGGAGGGSGGIGGAGGGGGGTGGAVGGSGGTGGAGGGGGTMVTCGGMGGLTCEDDEYCDYPDDLCGALDRPGVCRKRSKACPDVYDPRCGCDGQVHGNACDASSAGVDVSTLGTCKPPKGTIPCGTGFCEASTQYCQRTPSDVPSEPDAYSCAALPAGCNGVGSCDCVAGEPCGKVCSPIQGDEVSGVVVTCPGG